MRYGYLLDMDGVIYRGSEIIPGADRFVNHLRETGARFLFLTNNSQRTRRDVAMKLNRMGMQGGAIYSATKGAVRALVRVLAAELAPRNIRVNSINPGPVATPMLERLEDEVRERLFSKIPMGRFAEPNEIARAMLYLASDQSSWITGTIQMADGGESS